MLRANFKVGPESTTLDVVPATHAFPSFAAPADLFTRQDRVTTTPLFRSQQSALPSFPVPEQFVSGFLTGTFSPVWPRPTPNLLTISISIHFHEAPALQSQPDPRGWSKWRGVKLERRRRQATVRCHSWSHSDCIQELSNHLQVLAPQVFRNNNGLKSWKGNHASTR